MIMKNLYSTLLLISLGLCANLSAQTLKNIHRHNLPVLQIPVDLIDKVETVDMDGQKYLHVIQFNGFVNEVLVSQIDSITHSEGQALDPAQLGNLRTASVMGVVSGPTGAPEMNAIVRSPYGGEETRTDPNGVFFLNDIVVYDKLGYITITKPGFHQASRSFLPLESGSNRVNVQLLPMTQSGTFSATTGGTVTSGLLQLTFPANAIQLNGQPYTGAVNVYAAALDPSSAEMFDQMPGELLGGMNDSLRLLRSFGMAAVELRDANMNELQLANGFSATLTFNIPTSLQTEAPVTIDWWSFDETLGYWKHEGEALKQGSQYIGSASHFTWWNLDVPENFNLLHGTVNAMSGEPIGDAQVNIVTLTLGTGYSYTNSEGQFSGRVPKNQLLTLNVNLTCETTNDWALVYTEDFSSATEPIVGQYEPVSLTERFPINGTLVNCEGQTVESGYVQMGSQFFLTNTGGFTIQVCNTGEYQIRGYDTSVPEITKASEIFNVQVENVGIEVGIIQTCMEIYSSINDIDGNIYPTVRIGNQWWMAENIRATRFNDGSLIPQATGFAQWTMFTNPAWCYYYSDPFNDLIFGKLYNHFAAADIRNTCPSGWHLPTTIEWNELFEQLGGVEIAGDKLKSDSPIVWSDSSLRGSNESRFNGIPAGFSDETYYHNGAGSFGTWWSATELDSNTAVAFLIEDNYDDVLSTSENKNYGFSIRCVKD